MNFQKRQQLKRQEQAKLNQQQEQEAAKSISLSALYEAFRGENVKADNWARATLMDYDNAFRIIKDYFGDVQVHTIGNHEVQGFKAMLMHLPANFYKAKKQYEGLTVHDLEKIEGGFDKLSTSTINKYLTVAKSLFNYAVRGESMGRYGKRYKAPVLAEKLEESLSYNVDLRHLKQSRFVFSKDSSPLFQFT